MSEKLPNMLDATIAKIRQMVDVNSVIGEPIVTNDGITIIPITKVSVGFGGGGSDIPTKAPAQNEPFGGGVGGGIKVTPVAFLIIRDGHVRMLPVATPANTTADRVIEMIPETLDKIVDFVDSHINKEEKKSEE